MRKLIHCTAAAVLGVAILAAQPATAASGVSVSPKSGPEGTTVTIIYPKALVAYPSQQQALIYDPGVHGWYIGHKAGIYVAYDPHVGSKYFVRATAVPLGKKNAYKATIPPGVCGIIITSTQGAVSRVAAGAVQGSPLAVGQRYTKYPLNSPTTIKPPSGKTVEISLNGESGTPAKFSLKCDKYTFSIKAKPKKKEVDVPGPGFVITTLKVKGPAQVVVGAKLTKPTKPLLQAPVAFEDVRFEILNNFGALAPGPTPTVATDVNGEALVTVTAPQPGASIVRALAFGFGDARTTVTFKAKVAPPPDKPNLLYQGPGPIAPRLKLANPRARPLAPAPLPHYGAACPDGSRQIYTANGSLLPCPPSTRR
jgi:hypothetical protein